MRREIFAHYIELGFVLAELGDDKKPKYRLKANGKWNRANVKYNANANYAIFPKDNSLLTTAKTILIIDVDVKNNGVGLQSLAKLEEDLLCNLTPSVITGSGGYHIYVECQFPVKKAQPRYPNIDFISYRADPDKVSPYTVAGGQTIINNGQEYIYKFYDESNPINVLPEIEGLEDVLEIEEPYEELNLDSKSDDDDDEDELTLADTYDKPTDEQLKSLLSFIPSDDYHEWMSTGAVIKRFYSDDDEAGFEMFDWWSSLSDKYDPASVNTKWKQLTHDNTKNPRTIGTLMYQAQKNKLTQIFEEIKTNVEIFDDLEDIISDEKWQSYPPLKRDTVSNDLYKSVESFLRSKKITDRRNSNKVLQTLLRLSKQPSKLDENVLVDFDDWIRCDGMSTNKYYKLSENSFYSEATFMAKTADANFSLAKSLGLKKPMTIQQILAKDLIPITVGTSYNPSTPSRVVGNVLNTFDVKTLPKPSPYSEQGKYLIQKMVNHLNLIMEENEATLILDYLAYITQNVGSKVLYMPILQGIEGIGKSIVGKLMVNHIFGLKNSGIVEGSSIEGLNNSWATENCFKVIEELRVTGHRRYEILNNLKPLITNELVERREKYIVSSTVTNYCNFIAFTNHKDAIPKGEDDRRFLLIYSKIKHITEFETLTGLSISEYFEPLYELIDANSPYGGEFKTYLLERDISKFNPNFPPVTKKEHLDELHEIENAKLPYYHEIVTAITDVYENGEPDVIDTVKLQSELDRSNRLKVMQKDIRSILKRLGYAPVNKIAFSKDEWKASYVNKFVKNTVKMYDHANLILKEEGASSFSKDFDDDDIEL